MKAKASIAAALGLVAMGKPAQAAATWPDTFRGRLEAWALIETLNATLLASNSATKTLEAWCGAHHMAGNAVLHARLRRDVQKPVTPEQRARLHIGPEEPVIYRRVDLACGDHVLSQADNWYVPGRLPAAVEKALETSDIPFGRAIQPLHPRRQTFGVDVFWHPLPEGWELAPPPPDHQGANLAIPPVLFEHHAVVYAADGQPISEVDEHYTSAILEFLHAE
jgi:chorismate-pyruvate lyase